MASSDKDPEKDPPEETDGDGAADEGSSGGPEPVSAIPEEARRPSPTIELEAEEVEENPPTTDRKTKKRRRRTRTLPGKRRPGRARTHQGMATGRRTNRRSALHPGRSGALLPTWRQVLSVALSGSSAWASASTRYHSALSRARTSSARLRMMR